LAVQPRSTLVFRTVGPIIALALGLAPLTADAQQPAKAYQIGVILYGGSYRAAIGGLREGLRSSGLEEGSTGCLRSARRRGT